MSLVPGIALAAVLSFACIPGGVLLAQGPPAGSGGSTPLKMEDLEIRGLLDRTGRLYVPTPRQVLPPLPTRFDLFREDLARPILPREIRSDRFPMGGTGGNGEDVDGK